MPELPEVETVKEGIKIIANLKITNIFTSDKKLRINSANDFKLLKDQKVTNITRRARYLICDISNNYSLIIHLGMSARLTIGPIFSNFKHDHFACQFANNKWLIFNDPRRFGFIDLIDSNKIKDHKFLKNLGPEPLSKDFNNNYFYSKLQKKNINIKTTIMDNKIVVGVGNIYASESLFDSKISPLTIASKLTQNQSEQLLKSIKKVIKKAIKLGGSTISDYVNASGEFGGYQSNFKVYNKNNQPCSICDNKIIRIIQNNRSSFYCPNCQSD
jgi:formamidopyrimidine-DNA glycosylase